jgi:nucleotide-binding universal stress UspA family protein
VSLARAVGAQIILAHVFQGVVGELKVMEAVYSDEGFRKDALRGLEEWSQEVAALGVRAKTRFCDGSAVDKEILTAAAEEGVDLIVLGTHERGFLLKKTVNRVLSEARCPVLVADRPGALGQ